MELEWNKYYEDAIGYFKVAKGAASKGTLGNTVIYNVISMAVENFMTALLMKENFLPTHSSISSMLREIKKKYTVPEEYSAEVRFINRFMNFCSLEVLPAVEILDEDIIRMLTFLDSFKVWTDQVLVPALSPE